jgi:hypothetical protein
MTEKARIMGIVGKEEFVGGKEFRIEKGRREYGFFGGDRESACNGSGWLQVESGRGADCMNALARDTLNTSIQGILSYNAWYCLPSVFDICRVHTSTYLFHVFLRTLRVTDLMFVPVAVSPTEHVRSVHQAFRTRRELRRERRRRPKWIKNHLSAGKALSRLQTLAEIERPFLFSF